MEKTTIKNLELGQLVFGSKICEYVFERDDLNTGLIYYLLYKTGSGYGVSDSDLVKEEYINKKTHGFENDTYYVNPFCWCEKEECEMCSGNLYNFYYKPKDFGIVWYKYPLRGASANKDVDEDFVYNMIHDCLQSLSNCLK